MFKSCNPSTLLRCAARDKCQKNSIDKRSSLPIITPAILAETAECEIEGDICCHEADIQRPCTDYESDGYKCSETCLDLPQDFPREEERTANIPYYDPKNTHCEKAGHVCCKRTQPPPPPPIPEPVDGESPKDCESWGEGYTCSRMELCDPSTFAVMEANPEDLKEQTVNDLFSSDSLFSQNDAGGVAVNTDLVPCESALAVCCVQAQPPPPVEAPPPPPEEPKCPNGDPLPCAEPKEPATEPCPDGSLPDEEGKCEVCEPKPVEPNFPTQCGIHNPNGLARGGVTAKMEGASTQEGEWPHACLIFNEGATIGGASLIAPGVLLTAAHLLE